MSKNDATTSESSYWHHARELSHTPHVRQPFLVLVGLREIPVRYARKILSSSNQVNAIGNVVLPIIRSINQIKQSKCIHLVWCSYTYRSTPTYLTNPTSSACTNSIRYCHTNGIVLKIYGSEENKKSLIQYNSMVTLRYYFCSLKMPVQTTSGIAIPTVLSSKSMDLKQIRNLLYNMSKLSNSLVTLRYYFCSLKILGLEKATICTIKIRKKIWTPQNLL